MISVIVPVYNISDELLRKCINSILVQTLSEFELILIDDGSTNGCAAICDDAKNEDKRIVVKHTINQGVSCARNEGLLLAKGDYVCFVDPDDTIAQDYLKTLENVAKDNDLDLVMCKYTTGIFRSEQRTGEVCILDNKQKETIIKNNLLFKTTEYMEGACWGKLFKKSFLLNNELLFTKNIKKSQDRLFMHDVFCTEVAVGELDYTGYHYYQNNNGVCKKYNTNILEINVEVSKEFRNRIEDNARYKNYWYSMNIILFINYLQLFLYNENNQDSNEKKLKVLKNVVEQEPFKASIKNCRLHNLGRRYKIICCLLKVKCYKLIALLV